MFTPPDQPEGHRDFRDLEELRHFVTDFIECRLPKSAWTHRAHLAAGLWFLEHHGLTEARRTVPVAIRRFNESVGTANTPTSGYHETITQFYLTLVDRFRRGCPVGVDLAARTNDLYVTLGGRALPLRHYSSERLWSVEARTGWIEPDLLPLPLDAR